MKYPLTTKVNWLEAIRKSNPWLLLIIFLGIYVVMTLAFSVFYYRYVPLKDEQIEPPSIFCCDKEWRTPLNTEIGNSNKSFLDSWYFSVVTSTTLGYGDYAPKNVYGKLLVILQVVISMIFIALMVSFTFLKMIHPRDSLILSDKMVYDEQIRTLIFRVINVNRSKLINPEIRIVMSKHTEKYGISVHKLIKTINDLPALGNHDFTLNVCDINEDILQQIKIAREFNKDKNKYDDLSRFRIKISITGNYAFSQYSHYQKYMESQIVFGKKFETIQYPEAFHKKKRKYKSIPNFWDKFNRIE